MVRDYKELKKILNDYFCKINIYLVISYITKTINYL